MEVEVEEHLAAPASCGKMVSRRQGTAETQLTPDQNENNHKAMSHKNVFGDKMISTLFFGLFSRGRRGFLTLYNIRNSNIVINTQHASRELTYRH